MNIRWSVLSLVATVALTAQVLSFWQTREVLVSTVNERESEKAANAARLAEALVGEYSLNARLAARALSTSGRLAQALRDSGTAQSDDVFAAILQPLLSDNVLDVLEITDDRGIVRHSALEPGHYGGRANAWGVAEALQGKSSLVAHETPDGTSVLAIEPLRYGDRVTGAVIAGRRLNESFIRQLGKKVSAELALVSRGQVLASSSATALGTLDKTAIEEAFQQNIPVHRDTSDGRAKVVYVPLSIVDEAFVMMVRVDSSAAFLQMEKSFIVIFQRASGFLLLSLAIAFVMLEIVLRPLRVLRERAEETAISATGSAIAAAGSDEIGSVVHVLDTLTQRLLGQNHELALSRGDAQAANEAKSNFLSSMSHEIRTPLNGVLGMAELLQETTLTGKQRGYCEAITASGSALHELLSSILDLSKIEAGKIQLESIDFDLGRLLGDLSSAFSELAATRSNTLVADIELPPPGRFRGDPTRLRQVISNLLGNAIKFTERGDITLCVSSLDPREGDSRKWLRFSVRDSGVGIEPLALQNLFRPFVQADSSTTRRFGGTGLGLVISKHLVELLDGSLHVESVVGEGTRFWFDLPLAEAQDAEPVRTIDKPRPQGLAARVLLVEDNAVNQLVLKAMLSMSGAEVTLAENGALAVAAFREHGKEFDVVLMDCQMPVMDGYEAAAQIRAGEAPGRRIPIIALTANAFAEDREHCLAVGMDDYLTKPVKRDTLARTIARWTGSSVDPAKSAGAAATSAELTL